MDIEETETEGSVESPSSIREIVESSLPADEAPLEEGVKEDTIESGKGRDEKGRFTSTRDGTVTLPSPTEEPNPQLQSVEYAQKWRPEYRHLAASASPELQAALKVREADFAEFERRTTSKLHTAESQVRAIEEVVKPHGYLLEKYECSLPEAVDRLLWWNGQLEANTPQALHEIAASYGFQIQIVGEPQSPRENPEVERLRYELEQTKLAQAAQVEAAQKAQLQGSIQRWASELDAGGKPLRPYFEDFKPFIREHVSVLESQYPDLAPESVLQMAYDAVTERFRAKGFIRENTGVDVQAIQAKTRAAKAAGSSLKAEPTSNVEVKKNPKNLREIVEIALSSSTPD